MAVVGRLIRAQMVSAARDAQHDVAALAAYRRRDRQIGEEMWAQYQPRFNAAVAAGNMAEANQISIEMTKAIGSAKEAAWTAFVASKNRRAK